jgi:vacuolar-type H+-ATPase subunit H
VPSDAVATPAESPALDAVKRVKATETEWDEKLRYARARSEAALLRAREEADAAAKAVARELEGEKTRALERARADADLEAHDILAEGDSAAERAGSEEGKRPAEMREKILRALLGSLVAE